MMFGVENSKYVFKCSYKHGQHPCNGEHLFELDDNIRLYLVYLLIYHHGIPLNKETADFMIKKFTDFVEDTYRKNQTGEYEIRHFSSIDMTAELLSDFRDTFFKK